MTIRLAVMPPMRSSSAGVNEVPTVNPISVRRGSAMKPARSMGSRTNVATMTAAMEPRNQGRGKPSLRNNQTPQAPITNGNAINSVRRRPSPCSGICQGPAHKLRSCLFAHGHTTSPTTAPVNNVASVPARMVRGASSTISARRSGAIAVMPPMRMPSDPRLANPHKP